MKDCKGKYRMPILAAGGIVLRNRSDTAPEFAIVQSRKLETWGLPKGKLGHGEDAITAARREVVEETGHRVTVHEFLGTLVYETSHRPKVVQFWRMEAARTPTAALMHDVKAVCWLALGDAIDRLFHLRERVFLEQVGPIALSLVGRPAAALYRTKVPGGILVPAAPLAPAAGVSLPGDAGQMALPVRTAPPLFDHHFAVTRQPDAEAAAADPANDPVGQDPVNQDPAWPMPGVDDGPAVVAGLREKGMAGKTLIEKTWGWLRHAALLHRQPVDWDG